MSRKISDGEVQDMIDFFQSSGMGPVICGTTCAMLRELLALRGAKPQPGTLRSVMKKCGVCKQPIDVSTTAWQARHGFRLCKLPSGAL